MSGRLRYTCVHPAGPGRLEIGTPPLATASVSPGGPGQDAVLADASGPADLHAFLLSAALGIAWDAGASRLVEEASGRVFPVEDAPVPRAAVSVLPLRETARGLEAFVQHRVRTMDFAPGAVVFPGGRVDPADAARGTLLALPADAPPLGFPAAETGVFSDIRTALAAGVRELHEETGAAVDPARLVPWDNWITPLGYPRRFDVAFFLLAVEPGDALAHATTEASASAWIAVSDLVDQVNAGTLAMVPPTRALVDEIAALGSLDAALGLRPRVVPIRHDLDARRPRVPGGH